VVEEEWAGALKNQRARPCVDSAAGKAIWAIESGWRKFPYITCQGARITVHITCQLLRAIDQEVTQAFMVPYRHRTIVVDGLIEVLKWSQPRPYSDRLLHQSIVIPPSVEILRSECFEYWN
jgi:hypothetical protein